MELYPVGSNTSVGVDVHLPQANAPELQRNTFQPRELYQVLSSLYTRIMSWLIWWKWKWSRSIVSDSLWPNGHQAPPSMGFSRQEYWSGLPFLSPGNFLTQGSNPGLPHCRQTLYRLSHQGSPSVQLLSCVWLFATPWTAACQASLSITNSHSLLKFMSIESVNAIQPSHPVVPFSSHLQSLPASGSFQWISSSH